LAGQLRVSEDMIMAATRHIDDTHALVADCCWRASMAHDSSDERFSMDDFHTLRESVCDEDRLLIVVDGQRLSIGGWRDVSRGLEGAGAGGGQTHS
jgi:hypothetical protein